MSSSRTLDANGTMVESLPLGARRASGRATAVFPESVLPVALRPGSILLVSPAPAGVEEVPVATLLASPLGERIRREIDTGTDSEPMGGGRNRGAARVFGSLGVFAWLMLALAGVGSAFLTARPGIGLGLFLLLAPVLLAGADRMAFSRQRDLLDHEDVSVRASAMAGLKMSTLFGRSGTVAVREAGERRGGVDGEIAERIERLLPFRAWRLERKLVGSTGQEAPAESTGG